MGKKTKVKRSGGKTAKAALALMPAPEKFAVSAATAARAKSRRGASAARGRVFEAYKPRPGVVPAGTPEMALDDAASAQEVESWAYSGGWGSEEGQQFLGFPLLSILAQRGEYRLIAETVATEASRNWIEFSSAGGKDKKERIKKIEERITRLNLQSKAREVLEHDCLFGRGHWFMDFGDVQGPELIEDIGRGNSDVSKAKIVQGTLRDIRVVEPVWCFPQSYNSSNPLAADFYKPSQWFVLGQQVHASRFLTFVAREVPDILKPAYAFAGLSATQMARPYVDNWLDVRQGVTSIVKAFSTFVLSTNMADILAGGGGEAFFNRVDVFNATKTNSGVLAIDKDKEAFANVSAPISGLEGIQSQAQEHMASITQIPLVKLTGISPSGLNASGDQEMRCWEDRVLSYQEATLRPNLETVVRVIQLDEFGDVDEDIIFKFVPLIELTEQEKADLRKADADTGKTLVESRAISGQEERNRVTADTDGPYAALNSDASVPYPMTHAEKATMAGTVVDAVTKMLDAQLIGPKKALQMIRTSSAVTGVGIEITDDDIAKADEDPPEPQGDGPPGMPPGMGGPPGAPGAPGGTEQGGALGGANPGGSPGKPGDLGGDLPAEGGAPAAPAAPKPAAPAPHAHQLAALKPPKLPKPAPKPAAKGSPPASPEVTKPLKPST